MGLDQFADLEHRIVGIDSRVRRILGRFGTYLASLAR